jgi:hypothetical protein
MFGYRTVPAHLCCNMCCTALWKKSRSIGLYVDVGWTPQPINHIIAPARSAITAAEPSMRANLTTAGDIARRLPAYG